MPKIVTIFNNKGGVGKTTLTYHLAHALSELNKKVLLIDLDPQCNLSIISMDMDKIHDLWEPEDKYVDDFSSARAADGEEEFESFLRKSRSIHFLLKPSEDGTEEIKVLPPPVKLGKNVDLIPGRLTLHMYESKVGERWNGIYQGDPLSIRTATRVRSIAHEYASKYGYEIIILDTSPSLGALNKHILSLADGFVIPCAPDLFSVYGIRNIGESIKAWKKQFDSIFHLISDSKRENFPKSFVKFMGYTVYNARRYSKSSDDLNLAKGHRDYARMIPSTIDSYIGRDRMINFPDITTVSIGQNSIIHSHNTFPSVAQKYHVPMWKVPDVVNLELEDKSTIAGNSAAFRATRQKYIDFAQDFITRLEYLK